MRNAFIDELVTFARIKDNIVLVVGDLGYNVVEPFASEFPNRFFNAGVSEQNMTGLAAGLASEGMHVFTYSIANFPTFRCAEQIRNDIDYHGFSVTVVSVGGGLSYGNLGYSHHAVQDYALMRSLPNMLIASPGDPNEVRAVLQYLIDNPQPSYLRLGKAGEPNYNMNIPSLSPGIWNCIFSSPNNNEAILSTGTVLTYIMKKYFQEEKNPKDIYTLPLWGQKFKSYQVDQLKRYTKVYTFEDHLLDCGFGSWLLESTVGLNIDTNLIVNALPSEVCGVVGSQEFIFTRYKVFPDI